ncbi:hypothetical protein XELAEV_18001365mg [Xenopus laevis]|nr:hypothetical protein XELAEV_18001365mg [Xenopus laevis]
MGMWEEASDTGMKGKKKKDKNEEEEERGKKERMVNLTLEMIYLLTGEHYIPRKMSDDGGALHAPGSVIQKENNKNDKKILELMSNIIQLLTGEVAIRTHHVSIYFFLIGVGLYKRKEGGTPAVPLNKRERERKSFREEDIESGLEATLYNNEPSNIVAVEEADFCEQGNLTNPENSLIQWDTPTNVIKEEVASCKKRDQSDCSINPFTEPIQGKDTPTPIMGCRLNNSLTDNYILNGINEQSTSWEGGNQSDCRINPLTEHIQRTDTPTPIMGCSLAEDYISLAIKEEAVSWEGRNQSDCSINPLKEQKQGTDTPTPIMGCSSNDIPSVNYMLDAIKEEPTSSEGEDHFDYRIITVSDELQESDVPSPVMGGSLNNSLSSDSALNTIKGEGTSHEEENHLDYTIITISDQMHGADSFTAFSQTNDLPGYNITNQSPTALKLIYKCSVCNRSFDSKRGAVRHHKRSHELEKKFSCSECGKCFTDRSALKTHFKIHTGEKPYSCSECGKSFLYNKDLKIHYRIHTGEKPFSCTECGKHFAYSSDLKIHWRLHTGDKPFSCSECGKCFTHRSGLKSHERYHTGDKYSCAECGKCFVHGSQLKRHLRIHTGEKPFACSECDKCFYNSFELNRHFRIHTGEKPFTCPVCGHCFARRSHLTRHLKCHKGYLASPLEEGNTSYSACPSQEVTEATMEQ